MYTVTVLTPKGRRQQVKVTPNTTLLQVLEEVCNKHGFKAEEYDLRHHNKILDVSSMFRFTSLPNNAQLEMTEAVKQRQEHPVTLGLQFESGERLTGVFSPSESVWHVITHLKPEEEKSDNLVAIYMRQEIFGKENLKATTLKSLGLTGGRAMLRVLHKSQEELRTQANVSTSLPQRLPIIEQQPKSPQPVKKETPVERPKTPSPEPVRKELPSFQRAETFDLRGNLFEKLLKDEKTKKALLESRKNTSNSTGTSSLSSSGKQEPYSGVSSVSVPEPKAKSSPEFKARSSPEAIVKKSPETKVTNSAAVYASKNKDVIQKERKEESKVILLGERNAVAYNLNSVKPVEFEDEPEDFYDLTINDAKILLKQAKQLCAELEDAPLMTAAQRELEKDKKHLMLLNQYKKTVLRIKFPDRTVLQGTFTPVETVSAVEKFVKSYLEQPSLKFYLYTTPPKVILKSEERLIECGCVPCSVLYFGIAPDATPPAHYLKVDVLNKLSTPSAAALTAYRSRGMDRKPEDKFSSEEAEKRRWTNNTSESEPGTSRDSQWDNRSRDHESSPQFKVPKWFKPNK